MEASSLALAHDHARAAVLATHSSDTTVAINEHALAAGEFAKAASGTGSAEASRTLRLLEQHHQRLSELLRYPTEHPVTPNANANTSETDVKSVTEKPVSTSAAVAELRSSKSDLGPRSRNTSGSQTPRRLPPRELSSSIASNLASARGIRSGHSRQPLSPSTSALQAPGTPDGRREGGKKPNVESIPENATLKPSWAPPQHTQVKADAQTSTSRTSAVAEPKSTPATAQDDGFSKFYSAFNSVVYKLSAPLAFAGLPLFSEPEPSAKPPEVLPTTTRKSKPQSRERLPTEEPDLPKYISKAALRASARDGHPGNDSFYVVPTTGGMVSYAQILSFEKKEQRRLAASMHGIDPQLFPDPNDEDDFVDARETPMPNSPNKSKNRRIAGRETDIRIEELDLENKSLKKCIDKLSNRLHAFEMAAQNNGMALQESIRLMRPDDRSPGGKSNDEMARKVIELEEQMKVINKENQRLFRDNQRYRETLLRYREKFDALKAGARGRRDKELGVKEVESKDGSVKAGSGANKPVGKDTKEVGGGRFMAG